jgi:hypothetical protein
MAAESRVILVAKVKPNTAVGWLAKGKAIGASTTTNAPLYTSLVTLIQQVASDTAGLDKAQAAAANKGLDTGTARNAALTSLQKSTRAFIAGLQGLCDSAPDASHARALAAGASIGVKQTTAHGKADFYGKAVGNGAVHLYAKLPVKKSGRVFWAWQVSLDGGKTWTMLAETNDANYLVLNLTVGTTPSFRCHSTVKNVTSAWSQTIVILVQ